MDEKYKLYCTKCHNFEGDINRMHITKDPEEIDSTLHINFFCIQCGFENDFTISQGNHRYFYYLKHYQGN